MFELNDAVASWRQRLARRADLGPDDLDELEDHLREATADLADTGLSVEEAFLVAARRLGDADALGHEFATADPRRRRGLRMRWLALGGVVALALVAVSSMAARLTTFGGSPAFEPPLLTSTRLLHLMIQLTVVAVAGMLVWRLLTGDRAARRIAHGGLAWVVRVLALVVFGGAALFVLLALLARGGAWLASGPQLMTQPLSLHLAFLLPGLALLLVPLLLLVVVWLATRRSGGR